MTVREMIAVLLCPACWLQNYPFSREWDRELRRLMAEHRFEQISRYRATIGERAVWIENHPYASMTLYENGPQVRPSRATILAAHRKLLTDLFGAK